MTFEPDTMHRLRSRPTKVGWCAGRQFDPGHSIDVCFDFPLFRVAVALNTRKTEH